MFSSVDPAIRNFFSSISPQQQNIYNQAVANVQPQAPTPQQTYQQQPQPQPQVIQGAGDWSGYIGPGAANLANQARISAMAAAGNLNLALFQHPEVNDAIREAVKQYSAYVMPAIPAGAANMPLSQIERQFGPATAEATQAYYTQRPTQLALDIAQQYGQNKYVIVGSGISTPQSVLTGFIENPRSAAEIAYNVAITGGIQNPFLAGRAVSEGFRPEWLGQVAPLEQRQITPSAPARQPSDILAGIVGGGLATPLPQQAPAPTSQNIFSSFGDWLSGLIIPRASAAEGGSSSQIIRPTGGLDIGSPYIGTPPTSLPINIPTTPASVLGTSYPGPVRNEQEAMGLNQLYRAAEFNVLGRAGYTPNAPVGSQQWAENLVELSSAYHNLAEKTGVQQPANPFEYTGDLSLSYLKGTNRGSASSTYGENITDTSILNLPGGLGVQDVAWQRAKEGLGGNQPNIYPGYETAIRVIEASRGQYGPYAILYGGGMYGNAAPQQPDIPMAASQGLTITGIGIPASAIPASAAVQRGFDIGGWIKGANEAVGDILGIRTQAAEQVPVATSPFTTPVVVSSSNVKPTTEGQNFFEPIQSGIRSGLSVGPFMPLAIASDVGFSFLKGQPEKMPLADVYSDISNIFKTPAITKEQYESSLSGYNTNLAAYNANKAVYESKLAAYEKGGSTDIAQYNELQKQSAALTGQLTSLSTEKSTLESKQAALVAQPSTFDLIGKAYEDFNKGIAPYTTDVLGIGRSVEAAPAVNLAGKVPYGQTVSDVANFGKGFISGAYQSPVTLAASFGGGELLAAGEYGVKYAIAKGAMSELPVIGTVGRAASTPLAADVAGVGKLIVGSYILGSGVGGVISKPTPETKGQAAASFGLELVGFTAGYGNLKLPEPTNPYAGREFFSGQIGIGPVEKAAFITEANIASLRTSNPAAYREVAGITLAARTIEPSIRQEPDFSVLTKSGEYAPEIRSTLLEQPSSTIGSSTMRGQYTETIADKVGLRIGKDVDVLIESPNKAIESMVQKTSLTPEEVKNVADIKGIPQGYPGFKPTAEIEQFPNPLKELEAVEKNKTLMSALLYGRIAFPRTSSEIIKPGTEGYIGQLAYESSQVGFGRKGGATAAFIEDPFAKGYRGPKDIYDFITIYQAQKATAIERGVNPASFTESDKAIASFMTREFTFGTVKGQRTGDENPTVTMSVKDIYDTMFTEATGAKRGKAETPRITFESVTPERSIFSGLAEGSIGSAISPQSIYQAPSTIPSALASSASAISPSASTYLLPSQTPSTFPKNIFSISPAPSKAPSVFQSPYPTSPSGMPSPSPSGFSQPSQYLSPPSPSSIKMPSPVYGPGYFSIPGSPRPSPPPSGYLIGYPPGTPPPPSPPSTPFNTPVAWAGGGAPNEGRRKGYFRFRETILGINYNRVNPRTGFGATLPSLKSGKGQGVNFGNVAAAITGRKTAGRRKKK